LLPRLAVDALGLTRNYVIRDPRVALRCHNRGVPEELLQNRQAPALLDPTARERVARRCE